MFGIARLFVVAASLAASAGALAQADAIPRADAQAIRSVIEAQLAAFAADDAEKAFSFASEGIQKTFGSPDNSWRIGGCVLKSLEGSRS
jgi:hypothetical protein